MRGSQVFIDEPCNYLSFFSLQNFAKLLIVSSSNEKNKFYLTTNNLDLIDILESHSVTIRKIFNFSEQTREITGEEYQDIFSDRYDNDNSGKTVVFVEDALAMKFLVKLFPEYDVIYLNGEGDLANVDKFIGLISSKIQHISNDQLHKIRVVYDGNNRHKENKLPFEDVESYFISNYKEFINRDILESESYSITRTIEQNEKHDAYLKMLKLLNTTEEKLIDSLVSKYKDSDWYYATLSYLNNYD